MAYQLGRGVGSRLSDKDVNFFVQHISEAVKEKLGRHQGNDLSIFEMKAPMARGRAAVLDGRRTARALRFAPFVRPSIFAMYFENCYKRNTNSRRTHLGGKFSVWTSSGKVRQNS